MSADKYPSIFSLQMEAIDYLFSRQIEAIVYIETPWFLVPALLNTISL